MTEQDIKRLMKKYLDGTITKREESLLERFDSSLLSKNGKQVFHSNAQKQYIKRKFSKGINQKPKNPVIKWVRIAASLALLLSLGYFTYIQFHQEPAPTPIVEIVKTTEWGKKMSLTLPDGTQVKLNSGSTITFPERFEDNTREVELSGEAFFNVTKNPDKPFIIKSNEVQTTVLGTSFNINTYPDNHQIAVTVATGKVKVASMDSEVLLGPNEQGVFDKATKQISKEQINIASFLHWKNGVLHFEDATLSSVMKSLEQWYGVTFVFENENFGNCHLTASYDNEMLSAVLESIMYTKKGLAYEYVRDKKILIKGKCTD
ncbi:FecR domain-containing protein [Muricauda sp. CAU 1633]|uniref:FecR family protein n=1 Tax=Allomuricauda sp. CAU 1633 TaxID=2816036 RepID=UPI001A90061B|nr:FecR family protein [Muricauda sp. CAU 1633]MBO0321644.1 FecR domain-containing protein [Muricauda sp. CAU 1633]